jgi:hypothetical protein
MVLISYLESKLTISHAFSNSTSRRRSLRAALTIGYAVMHIIRPARLLLQQNQPMSVLHRVRSTMFPPARTLLSPISAPSEIF